VFVRQAAAFFVDAAVDHPAEMLGEASEEQRIDRSDRAIDVDLDPRLERLRGRRRYLAAKHHGAGNQPDREREEFAHGRKLTLPPLGCRAGRKVWHKSLRCQNRILLGLASEWAHPRRKRWRQY